MSRKIQTSGPVGNGWVEERRTSTGVRFIAYWKRYIPDDTAPMGRRIEYGGSHDLGPKVKRGEGFTSKSAAKKAWLEICQSVMNPAPPVVDTSKKTHTLRSYCEEIWFPHKRPSWGDPWKEFMENYLFGKFLFPAFGGSLLSDLRHQDMQAYLNTLAQQGASRSIVTKCRIHMMAVIEHAFRKGLISEDTSYELKIPRGVRKEIRIAQSIATFKAILGELQSGRDQLIIKLLFFIGVRRGELFGLKWKDYDGTSIMVSSQVIKNQDATNKEDRTSFKALPVALREELDEWRKWSGARGPEDYIFMSRARTAINHANFRHRVLEPIKEKLGLPSLGYHTFRRGLATEMHYAKYPDKSIQGQIGHASASTTRGIYMQIVPERQAEDVESFYADVMGNGPVEDEVARPAL